MGHTTRYFTDERGVNRCRTCKKREQEPHSHAGAFYPELFCLCDNDDWSQDATEYIRSYDQ